MRILVTGAGGFIGTSLLAALRAEGHEAVAAARKPDPRALEGADALIHLAGIAHRAASAAEYEAVNVELTAAYCAAARAAGVARFVLASSAKAAGETSPGRALTESDPPAPRTPYGRSKRAAELAVEAAGFPSWRALRLPLVHGPGARANIAALLRLAQTGLPLPLAGLANRRSLIANASAAAAFVAAATTDGPSGVFHIADRPALSTTEIVAALREGLGRPANLFSIGPLQGLMALGPARVLLQSLELDDTAFRAAFGYGARAEIDSRAGLRETARAWTSGRA